MEDVDMAAGDRDRRIDDARQGVFETLPFQSFINYFASHLIVSIFAISTILEQLFKLREHDTKNKICSIQFQLQLLLATTTNR